MFTAKPMACACLSSSSCTISMATGTHLLLLEGDGSCHVLTQETPSELNEGGGSLFDGEFAGTPNGWSTILLFDCYAYSGQNMRNLLLLRRYLRCERLAEVWSANDSAFSAKPAPLNSMVCMTPRRFHQHESLLLRPTASSCSLAMRNIAGRDEPIQAQMDHTVDLIVIQTR